MSISDAVQIELIRAIAPTAAMVGSIVAAVFGYLSLRQGKANHQQGERNHEQMNGRMEQMLELKGAAGEAIGQQRERDRAPGSPP